MQRKGQNQLQEVACLVLGLGVVQDLHEGIGQVLDMPKLGDLHTRCAVRAGCTCLRRISYLCTAGLDAFSS